MMEINFYRINGSNRWKKKVVEWTDCHMNKLKHNTKLNVLKAFCVFSLSSFLSHSSVFLILKMKVNGKKEELNYLFS